MAVRSRPAYPHWPQATVLGSLTDTDRDALLALGTRRRHDRGDALINEGDRHTDAYLLLSGCVKVVSRAGDGQATLLAIRVPGDLVGELAALDGQPRSATVIAAVDTVSRVIDSATLMAFLGTRPAVGGTVYRSLAAKLRESVQFRVDLSGAPVLVRLARVLYHLALGYGRPTSDGMLVDVPLTQDELAALAGARGPKSIQRTLAQMRHSGLVRTGYRSIVIQDLDQLRDLASDSGVM
jgi:CRP-like cAMP-binding protein